MNHNFEVRVVITGIGLATSIDEDGDGEFEESLENSQTMLA